MNEAWCLQATQHIDLKDLLQQAYPRCLTKITFHIIFTKCCPLKTKVCLRAEELVCTTSCCNCSFRKIKGNTEQSDFPCLLNNLSGAVAGQNKTKKFMARHKGSVSAGGGYTWPVACDLTF